MTIEQTVTIPVDHRLIIEVPSEVPAGKAILTFTSVPVNKSEALKVQLQNLQGSLGKNAFGALSGVDYQCKAREEWDD
jgi:hypothetical protein